MRSFSEGWAIGIARHSLPLRGEVDAANQATGVPSLGQESVNVVNGPDRHGNVAFLVDNDGVVREKCSYDAFGRATVSDPGPSGGRPRSGSFYAHGFLFQGREYIRELGVYDYRNRFYHAETGRFLQTDPIGFGAGDMNLFRYCGDDPVDRADPLGLEFTAEIVLQPNLDHLAGISSKHYGGTTSTFAVRAGLQNGKIVFQDVDIRATSYVRTYMRESNGMGPASEYARSREDIARTVVHEGKHLVHREDYYTANKLAMKKDFEDGKTYADKAGEKAIADKTTTWVNNYRESVATKGKKLDAETGPQRDTSARGNTPTASCTTGLQPSSAAAIDAALQQLAFGIGGGLPGEGFHPNAPN